MGDFFSKPLNWLFLGLGLLVVAMTAFVVFQPVKVVPRLANGPVYELTDQDGQPISPGNLSGQIVLFGFGYTHDPSGAIDQTIADFKRLQAQAETDGLADDITLALVLFDDQRDTVEQRQRFAAERGLLGEGWLLLGGDAEQLKRVIGQGFGVYYEAVPLADLLATQPELNARLSTSSTPDDYAYLQAQRYVLVDERNIIRAEYRVPLDLELIRRDIKLIAREKDSSGAERVLNEAAHLFLCYPS